VASPTTSAVALLDARGDPIAKASPIATAASVTRLAKATSDFGPVGDAMGNAAIVSAIGADRSWQQSHLRDAAIHFWLYKANPWVRTCVDLIAQRATADAFSIVSKSGDDTAVAALEVVLGQINPRQSLDRLLRSIYRDFQINGNFYGRAQFKGDPKSDSFVALYRVDFRTIAPVPVPFGLPTTYAIFPNGKFDLRPELVDAREIIHLALNDAGENGCGMAPLESLDFTLANDQAAIAYNTGFFQNGAKAGDIYCFEDVMDAEQVEREREYLRQNFTKPSQSFEPLFLSKEMKLLRDGSTIRKDMEFVKLREWNREEVHAVFSVPLSLTTGQVGALGANGKEQDAILFKESTIAPLQVQVFQDLNRELIQERLRNRDLELIPPKIAGVRLDLVQTAEAMTRIGATGNEVRRVMRLDDLPGLDAPLYLQPRLMLVGAPGSEDGVIISDKGAVAARIQDPSELTGTQPGATPPPATRATTTPSDDVNDDGMAGDAGDTPAARTDKQAKTVTKLKPKGTK
jgi:HK97 family phage portal protein